MNQIEALQHLFFSENKPEELLPLDLALATYLILRQSHDHNIFDSQHTLAARLCCERSAVARSIARLKKMGWISVEKRFEFNPKTKKKGIDKTSALSVILDALPQNEYKPSNAKPSEDAKALARGYMKALVSGGRNKFTKQFLNRQAYVAQWMLNQLDGDMQLAGKLIRFALDSKMFQYKSKSADGSVTVKHYGKDNLHQLKVRWKKLHSAFTASETYAEYMRNKTAA